ncbi:MAG: hypothetical protein U0414_17240 [Polyangiaceae bacterium]
MPDAPDAARPGPLRVSPWFFVPVALVAGGIGWFLRAPKDVSAPAPSSPPSAAVASGAPLVTTLSEVPVVSAGPPASAAAAAPSGSSPSARIARLKAIEAKPAKSRTIEENLELERGHVELGRADVEEIERALGPAFDVAAATRLRALARDAALAPDVLAALARHPAPGYADLLYDVSIDPHAPDGVRYLALDLLATDALRNVATAALLLALDLPNVRDCETMKTFVVRANESADDRSSARLRELASETGCGPTKKDDCWACLHGSTLLYETRTAVDARPFTPPWRAR